MTEYDEFNSRDEGERKKVGPMSLMYPHRPEIEKHVEDYYVRKGFDGDIDTLHQATNNVARLLRPHSVRPLGRKSAWETIDWNKNSGLPECSSNSNGMSYWERFLGLRSCDDIYPAVRFWRGQQDGPGSTKQRVVWGMDKAFVMLEAQHMYPLLNALRSLPGHAAWNTPNDVAIAVTKLMMLAKDKGIPILSCDISSFDASFPIELFDAVGALEKHWLVDGMSDHIDFCIEVAKSIPLVVPWEVKRGIHGMPSGRTPTSLDDTLGNRIACEYVAIRSGSILCGGEWMGDDSVTVYEPAVEPEQFSEIIGELGFTANPEKQYVHDEAVLYLQKLHLLRYQLDGVSVGVHSPYRSMSGLTGMERYHKDWDRYLASARAIMQVENCRFDPRFSDFVKFYYEGDETVRSGLDPAEIFRRAGSAYEIMDALDKASFPFMQYRPEGLESFDSVRILRELQS